MITHFVRIMVFFVAVWICHPIIYAQSDTLYVRRGESGKIKFARFTPNATLEKKMKDNASFLRTTLQMKEDDEFRLKNVRTDELGITHKRFQQYYKGVMVENAQYLLHEKEGNIEYINGNFENINLRNMEPVINEEQALLKALKYMGAEKYKWEEPNAEKFIKERRNSPNATYFPKGELVISKDYLIERNSFKLSWKFSISSLKPRDAKIIFVDAVNGEIIRVDPLIIPANTPGTAQTFYSGTQNITCDSDYEYYPSEYFLKEKRNTTPGNSVRIETLNYEKYYETYNNDFTNTNTNWTSGSWADFAQYQAVLDVHWGVEKTIDYWSSVHSRNGIDPSLIWITSYVPLDNENNAYWVSSDDAMYFGSGDGVNFNPWTSLDIVAHELGHAITQFTSNLYYGEAESAALNEGFSDIWGVCVKNHVNLNYNLNKSLWLFGEEILTNSSPYNCLRNIQNPKSSLVYVNPYFPGGYPDTYNGVNWNIDNWPPHYNSTILSHWFYILSVGKSGINDNNDTYNVTGIGINKVEQIAYKTLLDLDESADYSTAKDISIQAAMYLYGACSPEVLSVIRAWHAVGVGSHQTESPVGTWTISSVTYTSDVTICTPCNLMLNNVKVQNNAKLTIDTCGEITLNSDCQIELGSEFEIVKQ